MLSGAKACKSCRSRQELSNEYFLAKIGFDTAENEPFNFHNFSSLQGFNFHRAVVSQPLTYDVTAGAEVRSALVQLNYSTSRFGPGNERAREGTSAAVTLSRKKKPGKMYIK